jgi:hypothetical protein
MPGVTAELVDEATEVPAADPRPRRWQRAFVAVAPHLTYLLLALAVTGRLWKHREIRLAAANATDHQQFLWFIADAAHSLATGQNPLLSHDLNVPGAVNMMANTSVFGLSIPLAPVTLLFGAPVTFILCLVISLAGTASAWYWLLSKHVVDSRLAAFIGAGFCGFGPGMISQAGGHPNLTAQFLVPFIIWRVIRLREPGRELRNGIVLGLLVVYQIFINEEVLLLTAVALAIFVGVYALMRRDEVRPQVRPFLRGLAVTAAVALPLLAYPLAVQFFGPGHYTGLPPGVDKYNIDVASFPAFARRTLLGNTHDAMKVTMSGNEEASFLGWPLLLFTIAAAWAMWRRPVVRALMITGLVFTILSLGSWLTVYGHRTHIPAPLIVLRRIPPFDLTTATRYALAIVPVVGVLIALSAAALLRWAGAQRRRQALVGALAVAVLLPLAPRPLAVWDHPVPAFITSGEWRRYVDREHTLVTAPLPRNNHMDGMRWAALTGIGFALPRGYFMGPRGATDIRANWEPPLRPTSTLLDKIAAKGTIPLITGPTRADARADLRYWRAAIVVVSPAEPHADKLVQALTELLGFPPQQVGGLWLWDVRSLTA